MCTCSSHLRSSLPPLLQGPVPGVRGGDVLTFTFSATLEGAGTTSATLTLTAQSSAVMAVTTGPSGDVKVG